MSQRKYILIILLLVGFAIGSFADDFVLNFTPVYTDFQAQPLVNYEAGGDLLTIKSTIKTTANSLFLQSVKGCWGFKNPWPLAGFDVAKINGTGYSNFSGFNWDSSLLAKFKYYNNAAVENDIQHNAGEVYFSVGVPDAGTRKSIDANGFDLFQVNFHVKDGQIASDSYFKYDNREGLGGENKALAAEVAVGGVLSGNKLIDQTIFDYHILLAAPPQNFQGVKSVMSTDKGNTLQITWDALSNKIGESDWTPPIKYDIYRNDGNGDFVPDDNINRKFVDETAGLQFLSPALPNVSVLDGPNDGVPGAGLHILSDNQEYRYVMRAKDSTSENPNSINAANKTQHKTTNTDNILSSPIKPHDYTPPEWEAGKAVISFDSKDTKLDISWSKPAINSSDIDKYVVLRQGPFNGPINVTYPNLGKASGDSHGPEHKIGDTIDAWKVINVLQSTSFTDSNLENGKYYYYAIYTFDLAGNFGGAFQQGRNYSIVPAKGNGIPGVPPGAIKDFYSISSPEAGQISLHWTNPSEDWFGGVVFFASTDLKQKWDNIEGNTTVDGFDAKWVKAIADGKMFPIYYYYLPSGADAAKQLGAQQLQLLTAANNIDPSKVYFFKAFSFNNTGSQLKIEALDNNINSFRFSGPALAAAIPAFASGYSEKVIGSTLEVSVSLVKLADGHGINTIVLPKVPMYVNSKPVNTIQDLVDVINDNANAKIVTTIGYWDVKDMKPKGFVFKSGTTTVEYKKNIDLQANQILFPQDISLKPFVGYQVNVTTSTGLIVFKATKP